MILVTGAAGFIGSNLIAQLNAMGRTDIIAVDDLTDGHKFKNLVDLQIADYFDKDDFITGVRAGTFNQAIEVIFHQGACSTTTEWNGQMMMSVNFDYSKSLFNYAREQGIAYLYASSAATYGLSTRFSENPTNETPLNVYGYSKLLFDQWVRRQLPQQSSQVVGLRYFNVYGPREQHKGNMASVAYHFHHQILKDGVCRLFEGSGGYDNGEQLRDFVSIDDIVKINLWCWQNPQVSGIFNAGTGKAQSFNAVANAVIDWHRHQGRAGSIEYIPFPAQLKSAYQNYTQADMSALRSAGYDAPFLTVEQGVPKYLNRMAEH